VKEKYPSHDELLAIGQKYIANSYSPYSRFPVCCVIVSASGKTYVGVNVENGAYPLSRCAEQIAVGAMVTAGERQIREVFIYSRADEPATPCGACRQIISEFASSDASLTCENEKGVKLSFSVAELLPHAFSLKAK